MPSPTRPPFRPGFPLARAARPHPVQNNVRRATLLTTFLALGACSTVEPHVVEARLDQTLQSLQSDFDSLRLSPQIKRQVEGLKALQRDISQTRSQIGRNGFQIENLAEESDKARIKGEALRTLTSLESQVSELLNLKIPAYEALVYEEANASTRDALERKTNSLIGSFQGNDRVGNVINRYESLTELLTSVDDFASDIARGSVASLGQLKAADAGSLRSEFGPKVRNLSEQIRTTLEGLRGEYDQAVYVELFEKVSASVANATAKASSALESQEISYNIGDAARILNEITDAKESLAKIQGKITKGDYGLNQLTTADQQQIAQKAFGEIQDSTARLQRLEEEQTKIYTGLVAEQRRIWGAYTQADVDAQITNVDRSLALLFDQTLSQFYSERELAERKKNPDNGFQWAVLLNMNSREEAARQIQQILFAAKDYLTTGRRPDFSGHIVPRDITQEISLRELSGQIYGLVDSVRVNPANQPWHDQVFAIIVPRMQSVLDGHSARILSYQPRPGNGDGRPGGGRGNGPRTGTRGGPQFNEGVLNQEIETFDRDLTVVVTKYLDKYTPRAQRRQGTPREEVIEQFRQIFTDAKAVLRGQKEKLSYNSWTYTKDNRRIDYNTIAAEICGAIRELRLAQGGTPYSDPVFGVIKSEAEKILDDYALHAGEPRPPRQAPAPQPEPQPPTQQPPRRH